MNTTTDAGEPPYTATSDTRHTEETIPDGLRFTLIIVFLLITICYGSYISKCGMRSRSPPPSTTSTTIFFRTVTNRRHPGPNDHHIKISQGLNDDVLVTFPTFVYSDTMMYHKGEVSTDANNFSGCPICLEDYKPSDVLRLLPECEHLFHLSCIDTWLKVHPTCPVCRSML